MDEDTRQKSATSKRDTLESSKHRYTSLSDDQVNKLPDEYFQRTVKVVYLFRRRHTMKAAGLLRKMTDNNPNFALFSPMDRYVQFRSYELLFIHRALTYAYG
jgi:hypothetical protein